MLMWCTPSAAVAIFLFPMFLTVTYGYVWNFYWWTEIPMHNMHSYGAFYRFPVAWTDSSADDWQSTCSGLQSTALWSCTSAWSTITATANLQSSPRRTLLKMAACRRDFVVLSLLTTLATCNVMGLNQEDFIMRKHTSGSSQSSRKLGLIKACNKSKDPHTPQTMHNSTRWMEYPANQVGERQGF